MKITAKEIDLLVDSMMDKVYDRSYINEQKKKLAEKEWKETKKKAEVKEFLKLINNDYFYSIVPSTKMYDTLWLKKNCYDNFYSRDDFEKWIISKLSQKYTVEYPTEYDIRKELKNMLVIECLWWTDLKVILWTVAKDIKKKFKLS